MAVQDEQRFTALKASLLNIGPFRRGSVQRRFMPCGKPGCRCQADPPVLHGPYYQWTRKVKGKTVTVRLTPEQAELMLKWIANGRELDKLLTQMERVSLRLTERLFKATGKTPSGP
jgi:uncharacterized protein DUF6788